MNGAGSSASARAVYAPMSLHGRVLLLLACWASYQLVDCADGTTSQGDPLTASSSEFGDTRLTRSVEASTTVPQRFDGGSRHMRNLYEDLFTTYQKEIRPVLNDSEPLTVSVQFWLKQVGGYFRGAGISEGRVFQRAGIFEGRVLTPPIAPPPLPSSNHPLRSSKSTSAIRR